MKNNMKKYTEFVNEEVGLRNIKAITKGYKECEIYFHKDLDGVTSALSSTPEAVEYPPLA